MIPSLLKQKCAWRKAHRAYRGKNPNLYPQITQIAQEAQGMEKGIMGKWNIGMMGKKAFKLIIP
jgi:hypothetical protein